MQTKTTSQRAGDELVRWRREQLAAAGFPPQLAAPIAEESGYDLHGLIELAERGCPPDLAVRILAPLEGTRAA